MTEDKRRIKNLEEGKMRKGIILGLLVVLLVLIATGALAFENEPEGFRGLKWGNPPEEDMELIEGYSDPEHYWWSRDDELPSGDLLKGIDLRRIHYLFYRRQFMGVDINLYSDDYERLKDRLKAKFGSSEKVWNKDVYKQYGGRTRIILYGKHMLETLEIESTKIRNQIKEDKRLEEEEALRKKEEAKEQQEAAFLDFVRDTYDILMDYNPNDLTRSIDGYVSGRISQRDVFTDLDWARMLTGKDLKYFYGLINKKKDARAGGFLTSEIEWAMFIFLGARIGAIDYTSDMIRAKKIEIGKVTEELYIATGLTSAQTKAYYKALEEVGKKLTFEHQDDIERKEEEENKESREALEKPETEPPVFRKPVEGRRILRSAEPEYPAWAERQGMKGTVEVKFWVLPSGEVSKVEIWRSSGWPELDNFASQALMEWRFEPIEEQEIQWGIRTFQFHLSNEQKD